MCTVLHSSSEVDNMATCASCQCARNSPRYDLNLLPSCAAITSSVFSILGALIVLGQWIQIKRRKRRSRTVRDIITMLAVAEFVTASSYIVAGINFIAMNNGEGNHCDILESICKIQCFVTTWFSMSSNIWISILAIHYCFSLYLGISDNPKFVGKLMPIYYTVAFICPITIVMPLLGTGDLECFSGRVGIMYHPTAVTIVSLVIAGPFWVIFTFAVITISYILIYVQLVKYRRMHAVHILQRTLLSLVILFFFIRLWGIVHTFFFIIEGNSNKGGCFPQDIRTVLLVLETLRGIGEGGQGLVLYIFCLPEILKWFRKHFRRYSRAQRYAHQQRTLNRRTDTEFVHFGSILREPSVTARDSSHVDPGSSTFYTFPYEYEEPSEALAEVVLRSNIRHPHVQFSKDTVPPMIHTGIRTFLGHSSIANSAGFPTDTSLLSEIDLAQNSSETTRNTLLSVVHMHMRFEDLRMKVLHKFMKIKFEDFQQFLLSLPVCYEPEQHNPFFDTAILSSYATFPDLFDYLDYFWDYINYDLLECVIRKFGDDELKEEMDSYCTLITEVQSDTTLEQLIILAHSQPYLQLGRPHDMFTELLVRLEANWDKYSLLDAERLRQKFISTYSLTPYSIAFCTAHEGTVVLKLWLRSECAPVIFHCKSQPVIDSRDSKLLQITVDGILYQFHRFQVVNVEVDTTIQAPAHDCPGRDVSPLSLSPNEPVIRPTRSPEVHAFTSEQVDTSSLDTTHLHDLMCETVNIILEWYNLGLALGLLPPTLDAIQYQNADPITCRRAMLTDWLKKKDQVPQRGNPSWRTLVTSLRSTIVNREDVANYIAQKHRITVHDSEMEWSSL